MTILLSGCTKDDTKEDESISKYHELNVAIMDNDLNKVTAILSKNDKLINKIDTKLGYSPFLYAMNSKKEIIDYLINQGADIHHTSYSGNSALLEAADMVNPYAIKLLLKEGLDPNSTNIYQETPLILMAGRGGVPTDLMVELAGLLIDAGADPNVKNGEGFTFLSKIEQVQPEETISSIRDLLKKRL
ncbi:ankyrin repeat domain-containing protein [Paenibacillus pini]|nr:ankyrin repeat domain-containing protein [Paenibacillus pini]